MAMVNVASTPATVLENETTTQEVIKTPAAPTEEEEKAKEAATEATETKEVTEETEAKAEDDQPAPAAENAVEETQEPAVEEVKEEKAANQAAIAMAKSVCNFSSSSPPTSSSKSEPELELDWAGLPEHLVDLILDKLAMNLSDYIRLGVVCKAWNSCMLNHCPRKRITLTNHRQLPWLLLLHRTKDQLHLFNLSTGEICDPKSNYILSFECDYKKKTCIGFSYGWLIFMEVISRLNPRTVLSLLNPFSGVFFDLPGLTMKKLKEPFLIYAVALSRDPSLGTFEVLVASARHYVLALFRSCDENWTYSQENWKPGCPCFQNNLFKTFIFYKNRILAVSVAAVYLYIFSRDFDPSEHVIKEVPTLEISDLRGCDIVKTCSYFVETTNGDLLLVQRHYESHENYNYYEHRYYGDVETLMAYKIYKLTGLGLGEEVELVPIENLGGDCLFLGNNNDYSISVLASNYPGFMPNTIYCACNNKEDKIEVFNLEDGIVAPPSSIPEEYLVTHNPSTCWVVPSINL